MNTIEEQIAFLSDLGLYQVNPVTLAPGHISIEDQRRAAESIRAVLDHDRAPVSFAADRVVWNAVQSMREILATEFLGRLPWGGIAWKGDTAPTATPGKTGEERFFSCIADPQRVGMELYGAWARCAVYMDQIRKWEKANGYLADEDPEWPEAIEAVQHAIYALAALYTWGRWPAESTTRVHRYYWQHALASYSATLAKDETERQMLERFAGHYLRKAQKCVADGRTRPA